MVAYADWQCAQAPSVEEVFAFAALHPGSVLLIDTHCKEASGLTARRRRPTLLDWLPREAVLDICACCRNAHIKVALAGSLDEPEIRELMPAAPDWFAVRGAACDGMDRRAEVSKEKVRRLVDLLSQMRG
jgi:uncharacterized protein (UPF0264 family)